MGTKIFMAAIMMTVFLFSLMGATEIENAHFCFAEEKKGIDFGKT